MNFMAIIKAWMAELGAQLVAAVAVVLGLVFVHKRRSQEAAKDAVTLERARVEVETAKEAEKVKEQSDEIEAPLYNFADDDLRQRMRDEASD